ncbi:hypothetical protein JXA27_06980 [Aerococcaceae bacterium zg-B36]|uniref:hypothetical protein n=1 Tax=Aerococcaceae bacterium zg-252 TaxID=2796928 RepID=UPI001BD83DAD|nr:hypothetical protein [Aerococcaceae bacterium zg-B36]
MSIDSSLVFGKPIEYMEGINIKVPIIENVIDDAKFGPYSMIFTITSREIFAAQRNVDELSQKFPTIWDMMFEPNLDYQLGAYFQSEEKTLSMVMMEAFSYWTGLQLGGENGFQKLENNKKLIHVEADWVIDKQEFIRFSDIIKQIVCWEGPNDDMTPPKIKSDAAYQAWMSLYKGRIGSQKKKGITLPDKILILSISGGSYIPIDEIKKMTVYTFNKLYDGLTYKENYDKGFLARISPNYQSKDEGRLKHWKEMWSRSKK